MDRKFLEAFINSEHRILGITVLPFSLSHAVALEAINSPLLGGGVWTPSVALASLKILSGRDPLTPNCIWAGPLDFFRLLRLETRPGMARFVKQIEAYLMDFPLPELFEQEERSGMLGELPGAKKVLSSPWVMGRLAAAISRTSITLQEAMTMPLVQLIWVLDSVSEYLGENVRFYDGENPDITPDSRAEMLRRFNERKPRK